jgi:hypothetical protein
MAFVIGLPVAQIILFCLAIGHDPTGLPIAVTNHELPDNLLAQQECPIYDGCNYTLLSCRYLDYLKNRSVVVVNKLPLFSIYILMNVAPMFQTHFGTDEEAYESVRRGKAWGALIFSSNYSESLVDRTEYGQNVPDSVLDAAELNVKLDMSSEFHFFCGRQNSHV